MGQDRQNHWEIERCWGGDHLSCDVFSRSCRRKGLISWGFDPVNGYGLNDEFGNYDNCPDSVTVFCEDANGVLYRCVFRVGMDKILSRVEQGTSEHSRKNS